MKLKLGILVGIVLLGIVGFFLYNSLHFVAQIKTADVNGIKISYYSRGRGDPVLLLEDFGMNMSQWDPAFLEKLSQSNEIIVFDYRGVGNSSGSVDSLSPDLVVTDIAKLMESLKLQKTSLLGWAGGSTVAQLFAQKYPGMVNKLVLVSATPGGDETITASDAIAKKLESTSGSSWEQSILPYLFYSDDSKQAYLSRLNEAKKQKTAPSIPAVPATTRTAYKLVFEDKKTEQNRLTGLKHLTLSALIVEGEQDEITVPENGQKIKNLLKNAYLADVADAGHAVLFEKPNESSQVITEFLNK